MKSFVLLFLTTLLLVAINSPPARGQRTIANNVLLANVGYQWGWCIARNNDPSKLRWGQASMHMWDCNARMEDQLTRWIYSPERAFQVSLGHRGDLGVLCFDVPGGKMYAGAPVRLWQCHGLQPQRFQASISYQHINGHPYFFLIADSNRKLCLTAAGDWAYNGRPLVLDWCQRWANGQYWLFLDATDGQYKAPSFPRSARPESANPIDNKRPENPEIGTGPMRMITVPKSKLPPTAAAVAKVRATNATVAHTSE